MLVDAKSGSHRAACFGSGNVAIFFEVLTNMGDDVSGDTVLREPVGGQKAGFVRVIGGDLIEPRDGSVRGAVSVDGVDSVRKRKLTAPGIVPADAVDPTIGETRRRSPKSFRRRLGDWGSCVRKAWGGIATGRTGIAKFAAARASRAGLSTM